MTTTKTEQTTVHTVTIEGKIGEREIHLAVEAAREAGCTHYAIEQAHPLATGARWIAAKGRATGAAKTVGLGEIGGNPIDRA